MTDDFSASFAHLRRKALHLPTQSIASAHAKHYLTLNNEGVWISTKVFYVVGSLSLLSIITIAMEIAFYVYFHWIQ